MIYGAYEVNSPDTESGFCVGLKIFLIFPYLFRLCKLRKILPDLFASIKNGSDTSKNVSLPFSIDKIAKKSAQADSVRRTHLVHPSFHLNGILHSIFYLDTLELVTKGFS